MTAESFADVCSSGIVNSTHALGSGVVGDRRLERSHRKSAGLADIKKLWKHRVQNLCENNAHWLPEALAHYATFCIDLVLDIHTFSSREHAAVLSAALYFAALQLNVRRFDVSVYQRACCLCQESLISGRFQRAFDLIKSVYNMYEACIHQRLAWETSVVQLTKLLCIEARASADQIEEAKLAAAKMQEDEALVSSHTPLIIACAAMASGMHCSAHYAAKFAGVSASAVSAH
jgi:hypothetical protein